MAEKAHKAKKTMAQVLQKALKIRSKVCWGEKKRDREGDLGPKIWRWRESNSRPRQLPDTSLYMHSVLYL